METHNAQRFDPDQILEQLGITAVMALDQVETEALFRILDQTLEDAIAEADDPEATAKMMRKYEAFIQRHIHALTNQMAVRQKLRRRLESGAATDVT